MLHLPDPLLIEVKEYQCGENLHQIQELPVLGSSSAIHLKIVNIFEAYLELGLCVFIGLYKIHWVKDDFSIFYNNLFTIGVAASVFIMPFFTSAFHGWMKSNSKVVGS